MGKRQDDQHADKPHGDRQHDEKGILKGTELGHQNEIQQDDRERQSNGKAAEGFQHGLHHAAQIDAHTVG